jgi:hypothetical protein
MFTLFKKTLFIFFLKYLSLEMTLKIYYKFKSCYRKMLDMYIYNNENNRTFEFQASWSSYG